MISMRSTASLPGARFVYLTTKAEKAYTIGRFADDDCLVFGRETRGLPEDLLRENWDKLSDDPNAQPQGSQSESGDCGWHRSLRSAPPNRRIPITESRSSTRTVRSSTGNHGFMRRDAKIRVSLSSTESYGLQV